MKTIEMTANNNVVVTLAGLLSIDTTNMEHEVLVTKINEAIEKLNNKPQTKAGKWFENVELPFKEGDIVNVLTGWATGRQVKIVKPSAKKDAYKGQLYNPKSGELQDTLVGIDAIDIELYTPNLPALVEEAV